MFEKGWGVKQVHVENGFESILYINETRKQQVLEFKGVQLEVLDLFLKGEICFLISIIRIVVSRLQIDCMPLFKFINSFMITIFGENLTYIVTCFILEEVIIEILKFRFRVLMKEYLFPKNIYSCKIKYSRGHGTDLLLIKILLKENSSKSQVMTKLFFEQKLQ